MNNFQFPDSIQAKLGSVCYLLTIKPGANGTASYGNDIVIAKDIEAEDIVNGVLSEKIRVVPVVAGEDFKWPDTVTIVRNGKVRELRLLVDTDIPHPHFVNIGVGVYRFENKKRQLDLAVTISKSKIFPGGVEETVKAKDQK